LSAEVDDVFQETWIRVVRGAHHLHAEHRVRPFVIVCLVRGELFYSSTPLEAYETN
jgi:DNA-directed RNA polymerase specialized sigma24 family protein